MNLSARLLKLKGWKVHVSAPNFDKCIICVAPHTSNWDFVLGMLAYRSVGRKAGFLMKDTWFFFPLGFFLKALGGVPVPRRRKRKSSLVETLVQKFSDSSSLHLAITPEGTRSLNTNWHTGFLQIAVKADVPCILAAIDYARKEIFVDKVFKPTSDINADMLAVKQYYRHFIGKYPEKFSAE